MAFVGLLACSSCGDDGGGGDGTSTTLGTTTAGDGDGDGDGDGGDHAECDEFLECVKEATPEAQTGYIASYGPEGTCWDLPGVTEEDCNAECAALLGEFAELYPDVEACWECENASDCADQGAEEFCEEHMCTADGPARTCTRMNEICFEYVGTLWTDVEKDSFCNAQSGVISPHACSMDNVQATCIGGLVQWEEEIDYYIYCDHPLTLEELEGACLSNEGTWTLVNGC